MQVLRQVDQGTASLVGWGVRALVLCPQEGGDARLPMQIAKFGGKVTQIHDAFEAI